MTLNVDRIGGGDEIEVEKQVLSDLIWSGGPFINGTAARLTQVDSSARRRQSSWATCARD